MPKQIPFDVAETLITAVQKRECLYNTSNAGYRNRHVKEVAWKDVADEIQQDVAVCKTMWASLRCTFNRNLAARKNTLSGSGADICPKWHFYQHMLFLKEYVSHGQEESSSGGSSSSRQDTETAQVDSDAVKVEDSPQSDTPSQPPGGEASSATPRAAGEKRKAAEDPVQKAVHVLDYIEEKRKTQGPEDEDLSFFRCLLPFYKNLSQVKKMKFMHHMTGYLMELSIEDQ